MSLSPDGLAPGRFRLLLVSLLLYFGGTAAATGTRVEHLVEVTLLGLIIVAAVLDMRERGHRGRFAIRVAGGVILVSVVDLNVRVRHLRGLAGALIVLFAGLVVWFAYRAVMRRASCAIATSRSSPSPHSATAT